MLPAGGSKGPVRAACGGAVKLNASTKPARSSTLQVVVLAFEAVAPTTVGRAESRPTAGVAAVAVAIAIAVDIAVASAFQVVVLALLVVASATVGRAEGGTATAAAARMLPAGGSKGPVRAACGGAVKLNASTKPTRSSTLQVVVLAFEAVAPTTVGRAESRPTAGVAAVAVAIAIAVDIAVASAFQVVVLALLVVASATVGRAEGGGATAAAARMLPAGGSKGLVRAACGGAVKPGRRG